MEKSANESTRNDVLGEILVGMVDSGEHGLTVADILVSFANNRMLEEEREMIVELLKKEYDKGEY
jgi:hypothetical protein